MDDKELYTQVLGIRLPWKVGSVTMNVSGGEIVVHVSCERSGHVCSHCGVECPHHDTKTRRWRHLDTCQYRTVIEAEVPRVKCREHGVHQVKVPWAEEYSRFTALFESLVINWLKDASIKTVAEQCRLTWDEADGIMQKAVTRGLQRRDLQGSAAPVHLGVDETSFQKRHEYVTVVTDRDSGTVVHVAADRSSESLGAYYNKLTEQERAAIKTVSMDMAPGYIAATKSFVPEAEKKICFDRFHVMNLFGKAIDKTRRSEGKVLSERGDSSLKRTKFLWLSASENLEPEQYERLLEARQSAARTARAWEIKEFARSLWNYKHRATARKVWRSLTDWIARCRLIHVVQTGRTIKKHIEGILNAVTSRVTNAMAESLNARIQEVKRRSCGFRSRSRFTNAIYFHLGGLDLHPLGGNKHWSFCHTDP